RCAWPGRRAGRLGRAALPPSSPAGRGPHLAGPRRRPGRRPRSARRFRGLPGIFRKLPGHLPGGSGGRAPRRPSPPAPPSRRRALFPALCLALLLALVPLGLLAANPFTDLTGGVHDANIDAIYNAGVTRGCVPDEEYCPTANVTREEMASFLARLGGLGANK